VGGSSSSQKKERRSKLFKSPIGTNSAQPDPPAPTPRNSVLAAPNYNATNPRASQLGGSTFPEEHNEIIFPEGGPSIEIEDTSEDSETVSKVKYGQAVCIWIDIPDPDADLPAYLDPSPTNKLTEMPDADFMTDAEMELEAILLETDVEASSTDFTSFLGSSAVLTNDSNLGGHDFDEEDSFSDITDLRKLMEAVSNSTQRDIALLRRHSEVFCDEDFELLARDDSLFESLVE